MARPGLSVRRTFTRVAAKPCFFTEAISNSKPERLNLAKSSRNSFSESPAESMAARIMSPPAPLKQSKYAIRI
jgi:hypothetical protein